MTQIAGCEGGSCSLCHDAMRMKINMCFTPKITENAFFVPLLKELLICTGMSPKNTF